jgi:hypothetical protein
MHEMAEEAARMSQQLVALACCIDSHSHHDFRDVVLRDLAVLPCGAD